jgi:hypothetical protein
MVFSFVWNFINSPKPVKNNIGFNFQPIKNTTTSIAKPVKNIAGFSLQNIT